MVYVAIPDHAEMCGGCGRVVRHLTVNQDYAGADPVGHPKSGP